MAVEHITKKNKTEDGVAFSKRESQCMRQAIEGKNLQQISENLKITPKSACFYFTNVRRKIDVLIS